MPSRVTIPTASHADRVGKPRGLPSVVTITVTYRLARPNASGVLAYALGVAYGGLGDKERVLDWLETAYADRSTWMNLVKVHPELDPMRGEPRFQALLKQMGLD